MKRWPRWVKWGAATVVTLLAVLLLTLLVLLSTEFGARQGWKLAQPLAAAAGVQLGGELTEGTLLDGLRLQNLSVQQQGSDGSALTLQIRQFAFAWQPWRLLSGQLQIDNVSLQGVSGTYRAAAQPEPPPPSEPLIREQLQAQLFELPVTIAVDAVAVTNVNFAVGETEIGTDVLQFAVHLDHQALALDGLTWGWQPHGLDGSLRLDASFAASGTLNWRTAVDGLDYAGALTLGGTLDALTLTHQLTAPQAITSNGTVNPGLFAGQTLSFTLRNAADALDLAPWGVADARLAGVTLEASGTPDAVKVQAALTASYPQLPDTNATLALRWQDGTVVLDSLQVLNPELDFAVTGSVVPSPLQGQLTWNLNRLDPGARFPSVQLTGVTGNGAVGFAQDAAGLVTTLDITALDGTLNDLPLAINGNAALRDALPEQLMLTARSGDNLLELSGGMADTLDLRWNLQAPQLTQLWADLRGTLSGEGVVSGTLEAPQINGSLAARSVAVNLDGQTLALNALTLDADYQGTQNTVNLSLDDLTQNAETLLNDARITLQGTPEQHTLRGDVNSVYGALRLALDGGLADGNWAGSLGELALRSDYGDWTLRDPVALNLGAEVQQVERFCIDYLATSLCAAVNGDATAGMQVNANITGLQLAWANRDAPGKPVGLQALQDANDANLPQGLTVEGTLDLALAIEGLRDGAWQNLRVEVQPADLVLQLEQQLEDVEENAIQRFSFDAITLNAANANDTWNTTLGFSVANEETPSLNGRFDANVSLAGGNALGGSMNVNFGDLSWVDTLVPALRDTRGSLNGFANLGGTLEAPQVVARLRVADAGLSVPDFGLDVSDIGVEINSSADSTITARAEASAGEGNLLFEATLRQPLLPERTLTARLSGNRFTAVNMPGATAVLSPDIELSYANSALTISGLTVLDSANVDLAQFVGQPGGSAVNVSRDVVVVRQGEAADDGSATSQELALDIAARLRVGDDVRITGFGLNARLDGELQVEQDPGRPLLVYGELGIPEGTYEAYNQRLDTSGGRLLFFGNPANPVMDIRASRQAGSTEVGLQLSGPVSRMQGTLYSVPTLPENEILAMLVTGKSFDQLNDQDSQALLASIATFGLGRSQGLTNAIGSKLGLDTMAVNTGSNLNDSSLGLGKNITPKLSMKYDVGLFDRQFVLTLAYLLTERLKLEVKTGVSQSVDLSYTLEKD
jgi:translocation and assembly module TamB